MIKAENADYIIAYKCEVRKTQPRCDHVDIFKHKGSIETHRNIPPNEVLTAVAYGIAHRKLGSHPDKFSWISVAGNYDLILHKDGETLLLKNVCRKLLDIEDQYILACNLNR